MASTQLERQHRKFDVLTGLFNKVVLQKNKSKTVGMVCQSCHAPGGVSEEAYVQQVTGKGTPSQERQQKKFIYPECEVKVTAGLLLTHR